MADWGLLGARTVLVRCLQRNQHERTVDVSNNLVLFLPFLVVMGALMFFGSRRQRRAMQATIDLHESLQVGDQVYTISGLRGTITAITDENVDLEIADGVVTTWLKLAIRDRIEPEDADDTAVEVTDDVDRLPQD